MLLNRSTTIKIINRLSEIRFADEIARHGELEAEVANKYLDAVIGEHAAALAALPDDWCKNVAGIRITGPNGFNSADFYFSADKLRTRRVIKSASNYYNYSAAQDSYDFVDAYARWQELYEEHESATLHFNTSVLAVLSLYRTHHELVLHIPQLKDMLAEIMQSGRTDDPPCAALLEEGMNNILETLKV